MRIVTVSNTYRYKRMEVIGKKRWSVVLKIKIFRAMSEWTKGKATNVNDIKTTPLPSIKFAFLSLIESKRYFYSQKLSILILDWVWNNEPLCVRVHFLHFVSLYKGKSICMIKCQMSDEIFELIGQSYSMYLYCLLSISIMAIASFCLNIVFCQSRFHSPNQFNQHTPNEIERWNTVSVELKISQSHTQLGPLLVGLNAKRKRIITHFSHSDRFFALEFKFSPKDAENISLATEFQWNNFSRNIKWCQRNR